MKKYIFLAGILIYFTIIAWQQILIIAWLFFALLAIVILFAGFFIAWYVAEKMKLIRANRIEAEKEANVMTVVNNGQVFIRETDPKAWWRAAHLDNRLYSNGYKTNDNPTQIEVEAWQQFNRPKTIEKAIELPSKTTQRAATSFYEVLDSFPHLMLIGGSGSGKTTVTNNAIEYRLRQFPKATILWMSTHAKKDANVIHSKAVTIQKPSEILHTLKLTFGEYERRRDAGKESYRQIIIALDEWNELVDEYKEAGIYLRRLSRGSRKYNINLILGCHGANVGDLGTKGHSSVKDDFAEIYLDKDTLGRGIYQKAEIILPSANVDSQVLKMLDAGKSKREISHTVYGQHGQFYNEKIDRIGENR